MLETILTRFRKFFPASSINFLARKSGLVSRSTSRIEGNDFLLLLLQAVNTTMDHSIGSLCRILHQETNGVKLKAQSLWERIVNPKAVTFMETIYEKTLSIYTETVKERCSKILCNFFKMFPHVLIEDSTVISLNEKLTPFFKGCGGKASSSSLKLHVIFDVISNKFHWIKVIRDKCPDNGLVNDAVRLLNRGDLLIRDLGFFVIDCFREIKERAAFFVSRLHSSVNVYLKYDDKKPLNLIQYIKKNYASYSHGSMDLFVGEKERFPVRVVFYRAPEDVINIRKRQVRRNAQKKGRTPSNDLLAWQEYSIFITNLPEAVAPDTLIGTIYRIRWEIELIFKCWKGQLNLDLLQGSKKERVEVFLYAKLIGILLLGLICEHVQTLCDKLSIGWEVSQTKIVKLLTSMNFFSGLFKGYLGAVKKEFLNDEYWVKSLCKQKRNRKTTLERISALESFGVNFA